MESPENNWNPLLDDEVQAVRQNSELKLAIAEMKASYMTNGQALIHSDLHTGSIMANAAETKVIDPEFAFFGPWALTWARCWKTWCSTTCRTMHTRPTRTNAREYQAYLLDLVREIWQQFAEKFDALWRENNRGELMPAAYWDYPGGDAAFAEYRRRYIAQLLQDTAGFGGCKMLRRMMGIVSVWDISSIDDPAQRAVAERLTIRIGSRWVLERAQISSVDDLIGIVRAAAE